MAMRGKRAKGMRGTRTARNNRNKGRTFPPEVLTAQEVERLIRSSSNRAPTGIRNRALVAVLYRSGLRISEALALYPKDVTHDTASISVLHGKGDKRRTAGIDLEALAILDRWLDRRRQLGLKGRQRIFCTLSGKPLQPSYVRAMLPRLARRAGIEKRVHAHGLRHTMAAELMAEGVPVNVIQAQLGHSSVATTSTYLQHIAPKQVLETMRGRSWEGEKT